MKNVEDKLINIIFTCPQTGREMVNTMCLGCFARSRELAHAEDPDWSDPVLDGRARVIDAPPGSQCFKCGCWDRG